MFLFRFYSNSSDIKEWFISLLTWCFCVHISASHQLPGCRGSSLNRQPQTSLCPVRNTAAFQASQEISSLQHVFGAHRGLLLIGQAQNISPRRHPCQIREPPQLAPLSVEGQHSSSTMSPSPHRSSKGDTLRKITSSPQRDAALHISL